MKFVVHQLQVGDVIQAQITEVLDSSQVIISLKGDLARAVNETNRSLKVGDIVRLRVSHAEPLQFRVVENERRFGRLDIVT
jgi:D-serine deaminase-like pyridoxal phosphate-dependent protein